MVDYFEEDNIRISEADLQDYLEELRNTENITFADPFLIDDEIVVKIDKETVSESNIPLRDGMYVSGFTVKENYIDLDISILEWAYVDEYVDDYDYSDEAMAFLKVELELYPEISKVSYKMDEDTEQLFVTAKIEGDITSTFKFYNLLNYCYKIVGFTAKTDESITDITFGFDSSEEYSTQTVAMYNRDKIKDYKSDLFLNHSFTTPDGEELLSELEFMTQFTDDILEEGEDISIYNNTLTKVPIVSSDNRYKPDVNQIDIDDLTLKEFEGAVPASHLQRVFINESEDMMYIPNDFDDLIFNIPDVSIRPKTVYEEVNDSNYGFTLFDIPPCPS